MKVVNAVATVVIALATTLFAGCATPLTQEQRASISVVISKDVPKPEKAFYLGPGQAAGAAIGGIIGAVVASNSAAGAGGIVVALMEQKKIDVVEIVVKEFENEIIKNDVFRIVKPGAENATLKLVINRYGLAIPHGLSRTLYATLNVSAQLVKTDGTVLWKNQDYVMPSSSENTIGATFNEFQDDPAKLRSAFESVAKVLAKKHVDNMLGRSPSREPSASTM